MRKFVEDRKNIRNAEKEQDRNDASIFRSSRTLKAEDVQQFWKSVEETVPQHSYRLWNSLENGLSEYVSVSYILFTGDSHFLIKISYVCVVLTQRLA